MRRVFFDAQTVEHEDVEPAHQLQCLFRNLAQVGGVSEVVKTIGRHRQTPVDYYEGRHNQIFGEAKRSTRFNCVRYHLGQPATEMRRLEDIFEDAIDVDPGAFIGVKAERAVAKIQRTNIVEPEDVVRMAVRNQDRIQTLQAVAQGLLPEVGRSIDEN